MPCSFELQNSAEAVGVPRSVWKNLQTHSGRGPGKRRVEYPQHHKVTNQTADCNIVLNIFETPSENSQNITLEVLNDLSFLNR